MKKHKKFTENQKSEKIHEKKPSFSFESETVQKFGEVKNSIFQKNVYKKIMKNREKSGKFTENLEKFTKNREKFPIFGFP